METTKTILDQARIDAPTTFAGLTVFPLTAPADDRPAEPDYLTLDQAIAAGTFRVKEVGAQGSVPELQVINEGDRPVLLLDGEELVGAKQNRVLNVTVLCPAGKTLVIPVSCVEAGRWGFVGGDANFDAGPMVMYSLGRSDKYAQIAASLEAGRGYRSDQGAVWEAIADKARRMGARSRTGAVQDVYHRHRYRVEDYVKAFPGVDGQIGAVFALGARVAGAELFDHPRVLSVMLPKLVRSYALDAMEIAREAHEVPGAEMARAFLGDVAAAETEVRPGVGLGEDVRLSGANVVGAALVRDGEVVHLSAFRKPAEAGGSGEDTVGSESARGSSLRRWSRRRRSGQQGR